MPIVSVCDDAIGKWGIFDKKGNVIVPYVFDNILSSSDDFNYTHYEMDGITIRMSMCPIPYCKLPQMPEYIIDFLIPECIPMFIRVYKQLPQFGITECFTYRKCSVKTPPPHTIRSG